MQRHIRTPVPAAAATHPRGTPADEGRGREEGGRSRPSAGPVAHVPKAPPLSRTEPRSAVAPQPPPSCDATHLTATAASEGQRASSTPRPERRAVGGMAQGCFRRPLERSRPCRVVVCGVSRVCMALCNCTHVYRYLFYVYIYIHTYIYLMMMA